MAKQIAVEGNWKRFKLLRPDEKPQASGKFNGVRYKTPIKALIGESYSVLGTKKGGRRVAVPAVVPDDVKELNCTVDMNKRTLLYRWEKV
jgi:hypothetical protein